MLRVESQGLARSFLKLTRFDFLLTQLSAPQSPRLPSKWRKISSIFLYFYLGIRLYSPSISEIDKVKSEERGLS